MKIRKLQLKNIGVFDDETIEFQPCPAKDKAEIHIFTGENGSGKTMILMALTSAFDDTGVVNKKRDSNSFYKRFRGINQSVATIEFDSTKVMVYRTKMIGAEEFLSKTHYDKDFISYENSLDSSELYIYDYAVFAFSGYRQIENERVQANYLPKNFNPLSQSLKFIKDYRKEGEITINQLITNYISDLASATLDGSIDEAKKYEAVITAIQDFIKDIVGYEVKFVYKRNPRELKLKIHGKELDFDVLPDGLRSLISWIADLLGRVDLLNWQDDLPITDKNLILLLDEIEVHLHPEWQRKVLPVVQKLFKNSQIFVSTHSPFVVNSVDDAWVYKLKLDEKGKAKVESVERSEDARSYRYVLRNTFDIENEFGVEIEKRLNDFYKERDTILSGNGSSKKAKAELKKIAKELSKQSKELKSKIDFELFQLSKVTGEDY